MSRTLRSLRIGVIADSHVAIDARAAEPASWHNPYRLLDSADRLELALGHALLRGADVIVVLGDLVHYGDQPSLRRVVELLASTGQPVIAISGNHDVLEAGVRLETEVAAVAAHNVWAPLVASVPPLVTEAFAAAGLGLQVVEVTAMWPEPDRPFGVEARTVVDVDPGTPGVTLSHFPLLDFQARCEGAGFLYSGHLSQLAATPPDLETGWAPHVILSGHLHVRAVEVRPTALQLSFGALVEAPYDIAAVDIVRTGAGVDVSYECSSVRAVAEERVPVLDGPLGRASLRGDAAP